MSQTTSTPVALPGATPGANPSAAVAAAAALPLGSPERAAAMTDLYNGRNAPPSDLQSDVPEGVPAKFWDPEKGSVNVDALLQSYRALEQKLGSGNAPAPGATPTETAPAAQPPGTGPTLPAAPDAPPTPPQIKVDPAAGDPVVQVVTQAGLDPNALAAKVMKSGKLEDGDYAAIEKLGIPRALIDQHVSLLQANMQTTVAANTAKVEALFGGAKPLTDALTWAGKNLPPAEVERLNASLNGPNFMDAAEIIHARFTKANPPEPRLAQPGNASITPSVQGYRSTTERTKDMQDPRYLPGTAKFDPAFREMVRQKMAVATYDLDR